MKRIFANDNILKIISVAVAIIIWSYIILVLDPAIEVEVRDLPIQFIGQEVMEDNGISVVNESATTLNLKIKGSRKRMGQYDMKNIIAKVDVSGINEVGQTTLPVEVIVPFENVGISSQNHYSVNIKTEELVEKQLKLEVKTVGSLASSYMAGPITTAPETITIKGPESVIGKIAKAGVVLDYAEADVDVDVELPIRLYGTDGKEIPANDALCKRISQSVETTKLHLAVVKLREIKVIPQFGADTLEEERKLLDGAEYSINPQVVQIYGDDKLTAKISSIYTEEIPVEKFTDNDKAKAKLIIPDGVKVLRDVTEVEITLIRKGDKGNFNQ